MSVPVQALPHLAPDREDGRPHSAMGADLMDASRLVAALAGGLRQGASAAENRQRFSAHASSE